MPTLTCGRAGTDSCDRGHRLDQRKSGTNGPLSIVFVGFRIAEIDERSIAHILGNRTAEPGYGADTAPSETRR